jgi:hypothetical protein
VRLERDFETPICSRGSISPARFSTLADPQRSSLLVQISLWEKGTLQIEVIAQEPLRKPVF